MPNQAVSYQRNIQSNKGKGMVKFNFDHSFAFVFLCKQAKGLGFSPTTHPTT